MIESTAIVNKDSLAGGAEEGGVLVSLETRHIANEDPLAGGEEEGGASWYPTPTGMGL
jgi:hypothetical protein